MQVRIQKIEVPVLKEPNPTAPILQYLAERLDKEKFFGKIYLTFESGILVNTRIEHSYTTPQLADTLIR